MNTKTKKIVWGIGLFLFFVMVALPWNYAIAQRPVIDPLAGDLAVTGSGAYDIDITYDVDIALQRGWSLLPVLYARLAIR